MIVLIFQSKPADAANLVLVILLPSDMKSFVVKVFVASRKHPPGNRELPVHNPNNQLLLVCEASSVEVGGAATEQDCTHRQTTFQFPA